MCWQVIALLSLVVPVAVSLGGTWEQDGWVDGGVPDEGALWNQHQKSFDTSVNLAWWRFVVNPDSGDNPIFLGAPNLDDSRLFGNGLDDVVEVNCETTYFDGETFYQIIGGVDTGGRPCIYYSTGNGYSWTKNIRPGLER